MKFVFDGINTEEASVALAIMLIDRGMSVSVQRGDSGYVVAGLGGKERDESKDAEEWRIGG